MEEGEFGVGRREKRDLGLQRFGALMVSAWRKREFGWVEDKEGIWVSKVWGINCGFIEEGEFGSLEDEGGIWVSKFGNQWWVHGRHGVCVG